jgi:hypothetical protein
METQYASVAIVQFPFGIICAYWARTTSRNTWLWFLLAWFLAPVTGIVLICKNAGETSLEMS